MDHKETSQVGRVLESPAGPEVRIDGRSYLYFCGTSYLGLQRHPEVVAAASDAVFRYGMGPATTRAAYGTTPPLVEVERRVAAWFGTDDAVYLPSGYLTSRVLVDAIADRFDSFWVDESSHYSLIDALVGRGRPVHQFASGDAQHLDAQMREHLRRDARPLVLTDGVFAINGTLAPLSAYAVILSRYEGAGLLVDEAHALGALGPRGRGSLEAAGFDVGLVNSLTGKRGTPSLFLTATLSKACGGFGGVLPGDRDLTDRIRRSRYFIGATPVPTPIAAGSASALRLAVEGTALRQRLLENAMQLKNGLRRLGIPVAGAPTPVAGFSLPTANAMQTLQYGLAERGILIAYFEHYAGLPPTGGLRIAVFADHTQNMIERLLGELERLLTRPI